MAAIELYERLTPRFSSPVGATAHAELVLTVVSREQADAEGVGAAGGEKIPDAVAEDAGFAERYARPPGDGDEEVLGMRDRSRLTDRTVQNGIESSRCEFPLEVANQALELLKRGAISGSGVLLTEEVFRV